MRPRGIPAENYLLWPHGATFALSTCFNEAAGNTRGKQLVDRSRSPEQPAASIGFNEAAGNTRGKRCREG